MGNYVIKEGKNGFSFALKAGNGETIGVSEQYSSRSACENGIESVKKNAPISKLEDQTAEGYETVTNPKFELYKDKAGEFRYRLKARNGEIILVGEGYASKAGCKNGVESVVKNADSPVKTEK